MIKPATSKPQRQITEDIKQAIGEAKNLAFVERQAYEIVDYILGEAKSAAMAVSGLIRQVEASLAADVATQASYITSLVTEMKGVLPLLWQHQLAILWEPL